MELYLFRIKSYLSRLSKEESLILLLREKCHKYLGAVIAPRSQHQVTNLLVKWKPVLNRSVLLVKFLSSPAHQIQVAGDVGDDGTKQRNAPVVLHQRVGHHLTLAHIHVGTERGTSKAIS